MKNILYLLQKEFIQIFRNKAMLPVIFLMPILQLIILAKAANFDMKDIKMTVIDRDMSSTSRALINKFQSSNYFKIDRLTFSESDAEDMLKANKEDIYIEIPVNFEKDLIKQQVNKLRMVINAIDGSKAAMSLAYSNFIINDFNQDFQKQYAVKCNILNSADMIKTINVNYSNWYNPELNYETFMVPGILVLLITMIGIFLTAMNIVREKEIGTIEQINVTPISRIQFIVGKLIPFWLIGMFELGFGLFIAFLIYGISIAGSSIVLFSFGGLYLIVVLGMGLFISTLAETQQQAMFLSWFIMVIFILLSGLFTAIENMPPAVQMITYVNPIRYFVEVIRMVMLKGSGFSDIMFHIKALFVFAVVINTAAILRYRKTS